MKKSLIFLFFIIATGTYAQCNFFPLSFEQTIEFNPSEFKSFPKNDFENQSLENFSYSSQSSDFTDFKPIVKQTGNYIIPSTPVLTTKSNQLEVCEGNFTSLTATCDYPIEWYTSYPPEGEPIGKGSTLITPRLTQGYYVYYAVSNFNGIKSMGSEMEVVMVYPLPAINVVNSSKVICAGEKVTLKAYGTRYYEWNTGELSHELVIHPQQTTHYRVTGINTAGCKNTVEFIQEVQDCSLSKNSELQLEEMNSKTMTSSESAFLTTTFPNPNNGEFQVKLNSFTTDTRLEVYNSYGELVLSKKVSDEITSISLADAQSGIYTLRILQQDNVLKQEKVIVQK